MANDKSTDWYLDIFNTFKTANFVQTKNIRTTRSNSNKIIILFDLNSIEIRNFFTDDLYHTTFIDVETKQRIYILNEDFYDTVNTILNNYIITLNALEKPTADIKANINNEAFNILNITYLVNNPGHFTMVSTYYSLNSYLDSFNQ